MQVSARKAGAKRRHNPRIAALLLLSLCFIPGLSMAAGIVQLQLARIAVVRNLAPAAGSAAGDVRLELQSALGTHQLLLTPNRTLGVLATKLASRAQAYRGELAGRPGSWAALTRVGNRWTGLIFDGASYLGVDNAKNLARISTDAARAVPDATLVFRLADMKLDQMSFEGDTVVPNAEVLAQGVADQLSQPQVAEAIMAAATLATRRLAVALIADAELAMQDGPEVETNMLARLNIVDGYFASQVGVRLQSASVTVLSAGTQPFTTTDSKALLDELKNYRFGSPMQRSAGLSHLMTARDLDGPTGRTIGIAYIGGLCSNSFSASLSEARQDINFDAVVAAHEIGHVFGAPHDGDADYACKDTSSVTYLMAPQLVQSHTDFSPCSLDQIAIVVARAACLAPADAADGTIEAPNEVLVPQAMPMDVTVTVHSVGNATLTGASLRVSVPSTLNAPVSLLAASSDAGPCSLNGQVADCPLDSLAPDARRSVTFRVLKATAGLVSASLRLTAGNDGLASNNSRTLGLRFAPGADMAASATLDAGSVTVGTTVNAVITLENRGPSDVDDGRVVITLPAGLALQSQATEGISCVPVTEGLTCGPQAMVAGSTARASLVLRGAAAGDLTLSAVASSSAPEVLASDNTARATVQVAAVPPANSGTTGGGGGGGGSLPVAALAALAAMSARAARARRQGAAVAAAKYFAR